MKSEKNVNNKKRGIIGRIIVFLLAILAFIGLIAMILSLLSSHVSPEKFVWLSFFGLAFWAILLYNIVIFVLLLLMWSRKVWIAVIALLIAVPGIIRSYSIGKQQDGGELRVMTYNVWRFRDLDDTKKPNIEVASDVAKMVKENDPDVLCIQEFSNYIPKTSRAACIEGFGEMAGMPYHYYHKKANFCNNVIYSHYPLIPLDDDTPFAMENDYGAVAKVDAGSKGVFYVLCCHLTSFQLTSDEITVFSDSGNSKEQVEEYGKSILAKMRIAYEKRSQEVTKMLSDIPHDGRPIILCGDFNDTPLSYTYHQIKRAGFVDGFVKAGRGLGRTYAGKLPLLRIDYVWCNEQIVPKSAKRLKYKGSDHYPVMLDFNVKHGL
jgi:endonuclease/exonuclease/phosphatase (EEP) superfamily protein YafD